MRHNPTSPAYGAACDRMASAEMRLAQLLHDASCAHEQVEELVRQRPPSIVAPEGDGGSQGPGSLPQKVHELQQKLQRMTPLTASVRKLQPASSNDEGWAADLDALPEKMARLARLSALEHSSGLARETRRDATPANNGFAPPRRAAARDSERASRTKI